ncbi:MAG: hypothetical protein QOE60_1502, partial [Thermoleophilaceae bacterium]|nr:hypothetical protein [Thermoleophilaceae bacterium]
VENRAFGFVDLILRIYSPLADEPSYEYYEEIKVIDRLRRDLPGLMDYGPSVIAGTPDDFIAVVTRLQSMGVNEVVFSIDGLAHEAHMETIRNIGKYVIPAFSGEEGERGGRQAVAAPH